MTVQPIAEQSVTEALVSAVTLVWREIRRRHPDVPDVVLTLGSGTVGQRGRAVKLGHFAADRWAQGDTAIAELFIGGEGLRRGAAGVLGTLLHEAAHGVACTRGIKDTSRGGRYHNSRFRALGEELGLVLNKSDARGWSTTQLATGTAHEYVTELAALGEAITAYRRAEVVGTGTTTSRNLVAAACGCARKIRVARTTLAAAPIVCGGCGRAFEAS